MEQKSSPESGETPKSPEALAPGSADTGTQARFVNAKEISTEIEHFSALSSDLTGFLTNLSGKVQHWMGQLSGIQSEIELKKEELKRLHDIEASADALEKLVVAQRLRKESFESLMERERNRWEEEKARHLQEEREYLENLGIQRQRQEDEYKRSLAADQEKARRQLDEDLRALREENRLKLEALEKDYAQRELILKEKESEWIQLVQELEQFISRLANHTRSRTVIPTVSAGPGSE